MQGFGTVCEREKELKQGPFGAQAACMVNSRALVTHGSICMRAQVQPSYGAL
jgi:hypothetical protein